MKRKYYSSRAGKNPDASRLDLPRFVTFFKAFYLEFLKNDYFYENSGGKDSGLKTCSSNACLARVLGQNKGFCLSWLIVNKQRKMTVFGGLLRIEIDLVSSSISKVFAQQGVQ